MNTEEINDALERLGETVALLREMDQHAYQQRTGTMTSDSTRGYGIQDAIMALDDVIRCFHEWPHLRGEAQR